MYPDLYPRSISRYIDTCHSLRYFRPMKGAKPIVIRVERHAEESIDTMLRRFRAQVAQARVMSALKRKRYFVTKGEQRRMAKRRGIRRERRRQSKRERLARWL
jgi:small subunit ribosomal protein S21